MLRASGLMRPQQLLRWPAGTLLVGSLGRAKSLFVLLGNKSDGYWNYRWAMQLDTGEVFMFHVTSTFAESSTRFDEHY